MKRSDNAMARRVDDELIILDVTSGRYFELNDVGAVVWDALATEADVPAIVDRVVAEFDAPEDVITADVESLLADMIRAGLVVGDE